LGFFVAELARTRTETGSTSAPEMANSGNIGAKSFYY
jgi:hypothetical protein